MSELEPEVPPAGEEIHLPGASVQPVLLAAAIACAIVGITTTIVLVIVGVVVALAVIVSWIRQAKRDIDELPVEHH
jgi:Cytochrome c oxidase subunit IV